MRLTKRWAVASFLGAIGLLTSAPGALAGTATYDFSTDPSSTLTIGGNGVNPQVWVDNGGNPGGFLAVTWPINGLYSGIVFPDIDPGKIVTAFNFKCDLRVGNSVGERAADGFSISFARDGDPVLEEGGIDNQGGFAAGIAEGGTTTGIAVDFDTWSGNTLPDGADIEGIIVRVDNVTVLRQALPTRHGACDDITSLQTGPRDAAYWTGGGEPTVPEAWAGLCWKPFEVDLDDAGKLTVTWKGNKILDKFQTSYFPTAGRLVFAGRTGDANEHTHVDNIVLTTTAVASGGPPTAPPSFAASEVGTRRVQLSWGASTTPDSTRVAYQVLRGDTVIAATLLEPGFTDTGLKPGTTYNYIVRAKNLAGESSPDSTISVTTAAEVDSLGILVAEVFDVSTDGTPFTGATQADLDTVIADAKFPANPDRTYYVNGFTFGEPALGNTYGENHAVRIAGVITPPETGQYRFFIRSDDASRLYLNASGAAIPNPATAAAIAQEDGCCGPFEEPGAGENVDSGTFPTSEPVSLTKGQQYGVLFLVKEGGGGDWGQVAFRLEGQSIVTPAAQLTPIRGGAIVGGKGDALGGSVSITTQPTDVSTVAYHPAVFTVAATTTNKYGLQPVYQWYKNNEPILNANSATYSNAVAQPSDNGAKIKVAVGVPGTNVMSAEVTLTVAAGQAPAVASVTGSDNFTTATVRFDQPVVAPSATTAGNYTASGGLTISAVTLVDPYTVRLTTSQQTEGTTYTLTVNGVQNIGGTPAANATAQLVAWSLVPNRARADQYTGFTGATVTDMDTVLADPKWPNNPDVVRYTAGLTFGEPAFGDTWGENHMVAMKAVLKPTTTGNYRFFVRSDDASKLFINTSGAALPDPLTATVVAQEQGCCGGFEEPGAGDNGDGTFPTSEPISLTAGQSYGVMFLVKEGGGGDWGQVAYRREGDTTPAGSLQPITADAYWYGPAGGGGGEIAIDSIALTGGNVVITYGTGTLQSSATVNGTYTDVAGATSPYQTPPSGTAQYFRLRQ